MSLLSVGGALVKAPNLPMHLVEILCLGSAIVFHHCVNLFADSHHACGLCRDGLDAVTLSLDLTGLGIKLGAEIVNLIISVEMLRRLVHRLTLL